MPTLERDDIRPQLDRQRTRMLSLQNAVRAAAGQLWAALMPQEPPSSDDVLRRAGESWVTATASVANTAGVTVADDAISVTRATAEAVGHAWRTDVTAADTVFPPDKDLARVLELLAGHPSGEAWEQTVGAAGSRAQQVAGRYVVRMANRGANIAARESGVFHGWRRVTTSRPCGMCLADSARGVHAMGDPLLFHLSCRCSRLFLPDGVDDVHWLPDGRDLWNNMTTDQQNALFAGRGGADKAQLLRDGDVTFDALIRQDANGRGGEQSLAMMQRIAKARERAGLG